MNLLSPTTKRKADSGGGGGGGPGPSKPFSSPKKPGPRKEIQKNAVLRMYVGKDGFMVVCVATWTDGQWIMMDQKPEDPSNWGNYPSLMLLLFNVFLLRSGSLFAKIGGLWCVLLSSRNLTAESPLAHFPASCILFADYMFVTGPSIGQPRNAESVAFSGNATTLVSFMGR